MEYCLNYVEMYTDGSCRKNRMGGWGTVLVNPETGDRKELSGRQLNTTSSRMELMAVIMGLKSLKEPCKVLVTSDSRYVIDPIRMGWAQKWRNRGWKNADGAITKNVDLWHQILTLCEIHDVTMQWVKGHNGHEENERCDFLATRQSATK